MDNVAEAMAPEEQRVALAEKGQLTLNVTRIDRALRQIVAMEQEILGLREPATSRGPGSGGQGGDGRGRHDFNDLTDPQDIADLSDLQDLFDFDDPYDVDDWDDLEAMEKYDSFEEFTRRRKHHPEHFTEEDELELERRIDEELEKLDLSDRPPVSPEQKRKDILALEAEVRAECDEFMKEREAKWAARREALLRLRKSQKRLARTARGPPTG
jgi:hypothetical protein